VKTQSVLDAEVVEAPVVVAAASTNLAAQGPSAIDMSEDAAAGLEGLDPASITYPFFAVIQGNSPQPKKTTCPTETWPA